MSFTPTMQGIINDLKWDSVKDQHRITLIVDTKANEDVWHLQDGDAVNLRLSKQPQDNSS